MKWKEMREFDNKVLEDYKPGMWAPLDIPIGLQGITIILGTMIIMGILSLAFVIYKIW